MPTRPTVSVIIAVRNGERFLPEALADVERQTYPHREVIVVDGGSTDRSVEIARSFGARCVAESGNGFAHAWNVGMAAASGELIAILDSDDRWRDDKLERQVTALETDPRLDYLVTRVSFFLEPGLPLPRGFRPSLLEGDYVANMPSALLARRRVFETIGNFPAHYSVAGDIDWFARLKDSGLRGDVVQEVLVTKRVHDSNVSLFAGRNFNRELLRLLRDSVARQKA